MMEKKDDYQKMITRCPKLGHELEFSYCLKEEGDLPCPRIVKCWQDYLPIEEYLKEFFSPEDWERFQKREPKDKMTTLLELIDLAKKRKDKPSSL
ncbi:MAG: hypothetical protein PHY31_01935 [Smithellaceae bacterium]|nr:hypothetical protein [Smithellaceae bacterium]